ncbi:alpha/beta fold hydrolase [Bradyrhizobium sp. ISRA443]|uniref:alpha/beta hydrolase n=1 Tax=unclassified Bradyrhizobium TaxID=2631580 RepID=UPI0024784274|nr:MULTISPECIES: alpha/beta hydrolase [unclassified Bradyrhizobium]WGS00149.1 alpha/beta fold hydrolase [Bradyrhizobium sp. ISRA436]WGS07038.1 alpha/beta fold hydrolase [Bradyrhizobium sp. ISRA437]WGS13921.1 alpha/beta fold hydrolase [Bradyrhizobium sp. ISRA443]
MALVITILKWLLIATAVAYIGGLGVLFVKQRDMLFPIPPVGRTAPDAAGFPEAEEHVLTTADGEKVIVWHVPAKPGRPVVLFLHGNGDFLAGRVVRFKGITADGTGLVALSYRGYAGSSGTPSERGLLLDAEAAYAFATARYSAERLVAWGFSLGSGVAVAVAAEHPVGKLVLEAPYTSTADVAGALFRFVPVSLLMRDQFHSDRRIISVTVPLLFMHGSDDPVIPIGFGERLFSLAHEPKQFVRFAGGGHDDLDDFGAIRTARQFINAAGG